MAIISPYQPFSFLTDEQLTAALRQIEEAEINFAAGGGQRTLSIGGVTFSYGSRADLERVKSELVAAYNSRVAGVHAAPYKIMHLMR